MKNWLKLILGLSINAGLLAFVSYKLSEVESSIWPLVYQNRYAIVAAVGFLAMAQVFAALRMQSQFAMQGVKIPFLQLFKVTYLSFFVMQIFNFTGVVEVIRFLLLPGNRNKLIKALLIDKVVFYTAKFGLLFGLIFKPLFALFFVLLVPSFRKHTVAAFHSVAGFFCLAAGFSLSAFGSFELVSESAQTIMLTNLIPALNDWGSREYVSSLIMTGDQVIQGSIIFGAASLVAGLPGVVFYMTDKKMRSMGVNDLIKKFKQEQEAEAKSHTDADVSQSRSERPDEAAAVNSAVPV